MLLLDTPIDVKIKKALNLFNIRTVEQLLFMTRDERQLRKLAYALNVDKRELKKLSDMLAEEFGHSAEAPPQPKRRFSWGYRID